MDRTFIIICVCLQGGLAGCANTLYLPATPEERRTGVDLVGPAGSKLPIEAGNTSRSQIIGQLGKPERVSPDGRAIGYTYDPISGHRGHVALGGPCGLCGVYPIDLRTHETLWLAFGNDGTLNRYTSSREPGQVNWEAFCSGAAADNPATRPSERSPGR
jgi:hypothetical protein